MDFKFSLGLFIGFIVAGASFIIGSSHCIGISILVLTVIWGFSFVNPKSPVRKYWWSVSSKLGIVSLSKVGVNDRYLTIYVGLRSVSVNQVDKICLKIRRKQLVSDWQPTRVEADESRYINFTRPDWLHKGEYEANLIAYTPYGFSRSEKFLVRVDT